MTAKIKHYAYAETKPGHFVCVHDEKIIARMELMSSGEISWIVVDKEFRRQGIARDLWIYAQDCGWEVQHSALRTASGDLWARAMGGRLPALDSEFDALLQA